MQVSTESELKEESLDYEAHEEEDDDHEEDFDDNEKDDEDDKEDDKYYAEDSETRSSYSEEKEESSHLSSSESNSSSSSVLDSSENEACQGNRSWKKENSSLVNGNNREEDSSAESIESPQFEVIGHDSPSKCSKEDSKQTQSSTSSISDLESSSSNMLSTVPESMQSENLIVEENTKGTCSDNELQTRESSNEESVAETSVSLENTSSEENKAVSVLQSELKSDQEETVQNNSSMSAEYLERGCTDNKLQTEGDSKDMIAKTSVSEQSSSTEESETSVVFQSGLSTRQTENKCDTTEKDELGDEKIEEAVGLMKQALDKRDKVIETGSITELRKKRLKRYNSIQNMSQSSKKRLRRRSLSHHDLTSMRIVDEKSSSSMSLDEDEVRDDSLRRSFSLENVANLTDRKRMNNLACSETILNLAETATSELSESCSVGLLAELQTLNTEKQIDSLKRQRLLKNHTTSLQNITEENLEGSRNSIGRMNELRRSMSTSALDVQINPNVLLTPSISQPSSSTYETKLLSSKINKTISEENESITTDSGESQIAKEMSVEKRISVTEEQNLVEKELMGHEEELGNSEIDYKLQDISQTDSRSQSPGVKSIDHNSKFEENSVNFTRNPSVLDSPASRTRRKRTQSESLTLEEETTKSPPRRRRSSSLKIENVQKRILSRNSNRYSHKINFQPMEILNSDEDSFTEQSLRIKRKENKSSIQSSNIHENVSKEIQLQNELTELKEADEISDNDNKTSISQFPIVDEEMPTNQRSERGNSEPPTNQIVKRSRITKSASCHKLESIHRLVLGRQSLRKSMAPKTLQNLEVVHSSDDEKSFHNDPELSPIPSTSNAETEEKTKTKPTKRVLKENLELLDSPARRTRRSLSRLSETESLTSSIDVVVKKKRNKKDMKTSEMLQEHDDSASDISMTSSRVNTPTRRSSRIQSLSNTPATVSHNKYLLNAV